MEFTDYLAAYGAILSTAVFYWNYRRTKANLRSRIFHASWHEGDGSIEHGLRIEIQNPSQHEAHLKRVVLVYPMKKPRMHEYFAHVWRFRNSPARVGWCHVGFEVYGLDDGCPVTIPTQKSHGVYVPNAILSEIREMSIKPEIKVMAQDALWRNQYSKSFRYEV